MARTKMCDECREKCIKSEMVVVDYMTKSGDIKSKFYCSDKCASAKETRTKLIEDTNKLLEDLLQIPVRSNMYFNKHYKDIISHYRYEVILRFLTSEYSYIEQALCKDFNTTNVKIKYFLAIMQNNIGKYEKIDEEIRELETTPEDEIVIVKERKIEQKKSIFDF